MKRYIFIFLGVVLMFSGCSTRGKGVYNQAPKITKPPKEDSEYSSVIDDYTLKHPTMKSYVIRGKRYYPQTVNVGDVFIGKASWYGPDFHGKLTSNGEVYNMYAMTAAHKTLPMNTMVKVTNNKNKKEVIVRINDRGPFVGTRIIDLSNKAAKAIDMVGAGTADVELEILGFISKDKAKNVIKPKKKPKYKMAPKDDKGIYYLQIASFTNIDGAIMTQEMYDGIDGYKSFIKDMQYKNGRIFKVLLKGFKNRQEIVDYKESSDFKNTFIVKEG